MMESYGRSASRGSQHVSWREVQQMKKNMQKVPIIQKKSDQYHERQSAEAESLLDELDTLYEQKNITK